MHWKTTLCGILTAIGAGLSGAQSLPPICHSIGSILTVISTALMGIFAADASASAAAQTGSPNGKNIPLFVFIACMGFSILTISGCSTSAQQTAYKSVAGSDATVRAAMISWGGYVSAYHPGTNAEQRVKTAFDAYKNAELAAIDACAALSTNGANTNALTAAFTAEQAAQGDLLNIINTFTNSTH